MEDIAKNKDYHACQRYIEKRIKKSFLTEETRQQMIKYYDTLTKDNATETYGKIKSLYKADLSTYHDNLDASDRASNIEHLTTCLKIASIPLCVSLFSFAAKTFFYNDAIYPMLDTLITGSGCVAAFFVIAGVSVGH